MWQLLTFTVNAIFKCFHPAWRWSIMSFMKSVNFLAIIGLFVCQFAAAQSAVEYTTWNPAADTLNVLEGRAWQGRGNDFYNRLPAAAEQQVRRDVWDLSRNSAGLQLRFHSNAKEIVIRYTVGGSLQMYHMPATGVSGLDLYSKTINGSWLWAAGKLTLGDTLVYRFSNLSGNDEHVGNREYFLYLPLYNTVKWMEISVPKESLFKPLPVRKEKPVVVYGTSIAQGACATRPGLAWTNILARKLDRPVVNLGFSGNGRLEKEVLDYIAAVDAKLYVLDCLPNLIGTYTENGELKKRLIASVSMLQQKRPGVPILLAAHDGYTDEGINAVRRNDYQAANAVLKLVFDSLVNAGVKNIYFLPKEAFSQDIESMVDAVHPNDIGMMHYADAYNKEIRAILHETGGTLSTTIPVTQRRDANTYDWETRHNAVIQYNRSHPPATVFIGNSITHFWGGEPASVRVNGRNAWEKYFGAKQVTNMGFGWDRIENVLWRVYHGELDSIAPRQLVLMIGTNNLQYNSDQEIAAGLEYLIKAIREKQPSVSILVMGIFPRRKMEERVVAVNKLIAKMAAGAKVSFADAGPLLLQKDKKIDESLFSDGLHPNEAGYDKLGNFITQRLK